MVLSRREMCSVIPVALLPVLFSEEGVSSAQEGVLPSKAYPFEKLPVHTENEAQFRDVLKGKLATGESLEVHETTLPPGGAPHPPHKHVHSEMWLIREGRVELFVDGKSTDWGRDRWDLCDRMRSMGSRMWGRRRRRISWWRLDRGRKGEGERES